MLEEPGFLVDLVSLAGEENRKMFYRCQTYKPSNRTSKKKKTHKRHSPVHGQLCPLLMVFSGTQSTYEGQDKLWRLTPVLWGIRVSARADFPKARE